METPLIHTEIAMIRQRGDSSCFRLTVVAACDNDAVAGAAPVSYTHLRAHETA